MTIEKKVKWDDCKVQVKHSGTDQLLLKLLYADDAVLVSETNEQQGRMVPVFNYVCRNKKGRFLHLEELGLVKY